VQQSRSCNQTKTVGATIPSIGATTVNMFQTTLPYSEQPTLMIKINEGAKRRRLWNDSSERSVASKATSLCDLPLEIIVLVLKFLQLEDLGNMSLVSRQCAEARSDDCLDQTRVGTIQFQGCLSVHQRKPWNACLFLREVVDRNWNEVFQERRTRLRIIGLDSIESSKMADISRQAKRIVLKNVTSLDVSISPTLDPHFRQVKNSVAKSLALILPKLQYLDLSYIKVTETAVDSFAKHCPNLEVFRWRGSDGGMHLNGQNLARCRNLKEVYLPNSRLYCSIRRTANYALPSTQETTFTYENSIHVLSCTSGPLERVSVKGSTWYSWDINICDALGKCTDATIPQTTLIRFVESTPTLRWFESDLSLKNVEHLSKRFPNIAFC
jgi:hypothetical protein